VWSAAGDGKPARMGHAHRSSVRALESNPKGSESGKWGVDSDINTDFKYSI